MADQPGTRRPCKSCHTPILFIRSRESGKLIPLDLRAPVYRVERDMLGEEIAVRSDAMVSHFASCSDPDRFSKKAGN